MSDEHIQLYVGLDDTDSPRIYCTTYATFKTVKAILSEFNVRFLDYPLLVRLNPNIPWKTRGNGANAIKLEIESSQIDDIKKVIIETVVQHSDLEHQNCDPAIVFFSNKCHQLPNILKEFYKSALTEIVTPENAINICNKIGANIVFLKKGYNRGVVGALAVLGALSYDEDFTYELLAYRQVSNWGKKRLIDEKSVITMDEITRPITFNNYDYERERVLITPKGPDPVLVGIRGELPNALFRCERAYHHRN